MNVYFDTSVLIAAAIEHHPHHNRAGPALRKAHTGEIKGWISAHGIAEFYSVLTRVPLNPRVLPAEAWQMLEHNVLCHFGVVFLSADEYRDILRQCSSAGWGGGRVYDVLHIEAARKMNCDLLYTCNLRHFQELAPDFDSRICMP